MPLDAYRNKRDFDVTTEPEGSRAGVGGRRFVLQEHHATQLHFDLRLEIDGVLKSWAVPKGPSFNPADRRLAVQTEDHPLEYLDYAGHIPDGSYGAGDMVVWDSGTYDILEGDDPAQEWRLGRLKLRLFGQKLRGKFALIRMTKTENQWLLIKDHDEYEDRDWKLTPIYNWGSNKSKPKGDAAAVVMDIAAIEGARPADMPTRVDPMLGTLIDEPFTSDDWLFELKWDGYRGICFVENGTARIVSRNANDLGERYRDLPRLPGKVRARSAILDGELTALDERGRAQFQLLQTALQTGHSVVYYAFDILYCDGFDLTGCRLIDRKRLLQQILAVDNSLRYSDHVVGNGKAFYDKACEAGVEGLMAKRMASKYDGGRSREWLKIKILQRADVVIGGYTEPRGSRKLIGSLLAGAYRDGALVPVGHVSIGSSEQTIEAIYNRLHPLETSHSPFAETPRMNEKAHWVEPALVAEVKFGEWTQDHQMRHPILLGLREDKAPTECLLETAIATNAAVDESAPSASPSLKGGESRTHPGSFLASPPETGGGRATEESFDSRAGTPTPHAEGRRSATETDTVDALFDRSIGPDAVLHVDGNRVPVTNLDKVYWPADGFTKRDLLRYYFEIGPTMLPYLRRRPLILRRYVNGIAAAPFFQHDVNKAPEFVNIFEHPESDKTIRYAVCDNLAAMLYLANLGAISFDPWLSQVPSENDTALRPDVAIFDLDPGDVTIGDVCRVAVAIRDELAGLGLKAFAKTSGVSGIHIYLPIEPLYDFDVVFAFAGLIAMRVVDAMPDLATVERRIGKRGANKVYIDCVQNSEGKSVAAPYAVRAHRGATVSAPVSWEELEQTIRIEDYSITNMVSRVRTVGDLFAPVSASDRQRLSTALDILHDGATKQPA